MESDSNEEYLKGRDDYDHTVNVIERLNKWKMELEKKTLDDPRDVNSHGLISELELSIARLKLLAGTEIRSTRPKLFRLQDTPDDYDYRIMCEWGYENRDQWGDAEVDGKEIKVYAGDYIICM
jgi:hypothetical protein